MSLTENGFTVEDVEETAGQLLRRHLRTRKLTQAVAAEELGCSAKHLNQVLRGHKLLSVDLAVAFEQLMEWPGLAEQALILQVRSELRERGL